MVHSTQTMDLSCIKVSTISKRTELSFHLNHGPISEPIVCLAQTVLLSCTDSNTVCKWTKMRFHMTHVPFLCVQNDFRACGMFSAYEISTFSKRTKMSVHLSLITYEYLRVRPKWILSLWYVWCKPCTYLAPTLTLSPNRLKQDSRWPTSLGRSIECVQINFWPYGMFDANRAPILR
jgi:hypothetical protein